MISNKLMQEYLTMYGEYGTQPFTLKQASELCGMPPAKLRKDVYKLKTNYALQGIKRGTYQVTEPEKWIGIGAALQKMPELSPLFKNILPKLRSIESIILYGSRVRGDYRKDSDYDLLVVTDGKEIFTEEEVDELKKQGYELQVSYESDLKKEVKDRPVSIVPILKEGWPLFNLKVRDGLLKSYRKEKLLNDLKTLSNDIIKNKHYTLKGLKGEGKRSSLFLSFFSSRQLYLIETLMKGRGFYTQDWLEKISEIWNIDIKTMNELHKAYRSIEKGTKVDANILKNKTLKHIAVWNLEYLNMVYNEWKENYG